MGVTFGAGLTFSGGGMTIQAPPPALTADYLIVAGGGGGGTYNEIAYGGPGGGGGGGLLTSSVVFDAGVTYTIAVGAGGLGGQSKYGIWGSQGANTSLSGTGLSITTYGGGYGGEGYQYNADVGAPGGPGGSGGGAGGGGNYNKLGGLGVYPGSAYIDAPRQGYDGSGSLYTTRAGGGGGGAGEARDRTVYNGNGANGLYSTISGANVAYAGGGAGSGTAGAGGGGGINTGGGGNGGAAPAQNGGSGIVIIRLSDSVPLANTTGSPTITTSGGYRIYQFTGSGSITF